MTNSQRYYLELVTDYIIGDEDLVQDSLVEGSEAEKVVKAAAMLKDAFLPDEKFKPKSQHENDH